MKYKWEEIYNILRNRIVSGEYQPGQEFPTNFELMKEFGVQTATVQTAVNRLIMDGLLLSEGGRKPRIVRRQPYRSTRVGGFAGFGKEHGKRAAKQCLELRLLGTNEDLPADVRKELQPPVLSYHVLQLLNDQPMSISRSYLPNSLPLKELEKILEGVKQDPTLSLYKTLESLGRKPITCEETLIAEIPSPEETELLQMPKHSSIPVIRITRRTFDASSRLVEYCLLTIRADCHQLVYRFTL